MRIIEYYLLPEAGYTGEYDRKEGHYIIKKGTIAGMLHDSMMLWSSDFDKVIPTYVCLNDILQEGYWPRLVEWDSLTIEVEEYEQVVQALLEIQMDKPYRRNEESQ